MRNYQFVTQRECTDADIQNFLRENKLRIQSNYHVVDDLSTVRLVEGGFGICLMPELCMNDIPYDVDIFPLQNEAYRIIGIAALNPDQSDGYYYFVANMCEGGTAFARTWSQHEVNIDRYYLACD